MEHVHQSKLKWILYKRKLHRQSCFILLWCYYIQIEIQLSSICFVVYRQDILHNFRRLFECKRQTSHMFYTCHTRSKTSLLVITFLLSSCIRITFKAWETIFCHNTVRLQILNLFWFLSFHLNNQNVSGR
jgi:hypothetical protein